MSQNTPSSKTLAKAIAVFGGAQAFAVLAALIRAKVASVTIGATGLGLNALFVTIVNLVSTLLGCGLANSSVPQLCQQQGADRLASISRLRLLGVLLALASVPVTLIVACYYGADVLWLVIPIMAQVLSGIEMAVMKSLQATRLLSLSLILSAVFSVVCTVPFFLLMGIDGILWSVVCTLTLSSLFTCAMGYRACPALPDFSLLGSGLWHQSRPMFVLGFAFLLSGVLSYGVDLFLQTWLTHRATLATVGLYKAGYQLAVTYTGMLFAAIANDFFPRLSAVSHDVATRNHLVIQQLRVLLVIVTPIILLFILVVPWIVPLLYSGEFLPIVPMVRIAALSVIVKAVYLPIGYLPVSLGRSWHFLLLESISWLSVAAGVVIGYHFSGLTGVGYGLLLSNVLDLFLVSLFCYRQYHFRLA